jgi:hypothetical protein
MPVSRTVLFLAYIYGTWSFPFPHVSSPDTKALAPLRTKTALESIQAFNATFANNLLREKNVHKLAVPPSTENLNDYAVQRYRCRPGIVLSATQVVKHESYKKSLALLLNYDDGDYTTALMLNKPTEYTVKQLFKDMPDICNAFGNYTIFQGTICMYEHMRT